MSVELLLFVLRVVSALLLFSLVTVLFLALWRDHRQTIEHIQSTRRIYGQLISVEEKDGHLLPLDETYALLPVTSLGRAPTNTIMIDDSFASSEHARVVLRDGHWWLEDRQSRNGTLLNGRPVSQPVIMTQGDVIGVGQKRFRLDLFG